MQDCKWKLLGKRRGGGQVVSLLAYYSDGPSLNPNEAYSFFCNIVFEKNENKQKEARISPLFSKILGNVCI